MPRALTGTIKPHGDHFDARITMPDGSRPWIHLPGGLTDEQARAKAASLSATARVRNAARIVKTDEKPANPPSGETLAVWSDRWCDDREERGLTSVKDDRGRLRKWVIPHLGPRAMVDIKRIDLERLVEELDANVRAELLSWKTARNTWGVVSKMFDDACRSKTLALRVLTENPCEGVRGPDEGVKKSKQQHSARPVSWRAQSALTQAASALRRIGVPSDASRRAAPVSRAPAGEAMAAGSRAPQAMAAGGTRPAGKSAARETGTAGASPPHPTKPRPVTPAPASRVPSTTTATTRAQSPATKSAHSSSRAKHKTSPFNSTPGKASRPKSTATKPGRSAAKGTQPTKTSAAPPGCACNIRTSNVTLAVSEMHAFQQYYLEERGMQIDAAKRALASLGADASLLKSLLSQVDAEPSTSGTRSNDVIGAIGEAHLSYHLERRLDTAGKIVLTRAGWKTMQFDAVRGVDLVGVRLADCMLCYVESKTRRDPRAKSKKKTLEELRDDLSLTRLLPRFEGRLDAGAPLVVASTMRDLIIRGKVTDFTSFRLSNLAPGKFHRIGAIAVPCTKGWHPIAGACPCDLNLDRTCELILVVIEDMTKVFKHLLALEIHRLSY